MCPRPASVPRGGAEASMKLRVLIVGLSAGLFAAPAPPRLFAAVSVGLASVVAATESATESQSDPWAGWENPPIDDLINEAEVLFKNEAKYRKKTIRRAKTFYRSLREKIDKDYRRLKREINERKTRIGYQLKSQRVAASQLEAVLGQDKTMYDRVASKTMQQWLDLGYAVKKMVNLDGNKIAEQYVDFDNSFQRLVDQTNHQAWMHAIQQYSTFGQMLQKTNDLITHVRKQYNNATSLLPVIDAGITTFESTENTAIDTLAAGIQQNSIIPNLTAASNEFSRSRSREFDKAKQGVALVDERLRDYLENKVQFDFTGLENDEESSWNAGYKEVKRTMDRAVKQGTRTHEKVKKEVDKAKQFVNNFMKTNMTELKEMARSVGAETKGVIKEARNMWKEAKSDIKAQLKESRADTKSMIENGKEKALRYALKAKRKAGFQIMKFSRKVQRSLSKASTKLEQMKTKEQDSQTEDNDRLLDLEEQLKGAEEQLKQDTAVNSRQVDKLRGLNLKLVEKSSKISQGDATVKMANALANVTEETQRETDENKKKEEQKVREFEDTVTALGEQQSKVFKLAEGKIDAFAAKVKKRRKTVEATQEKRQEEIDQLKNEFPQLNVYAEEVKRTVARAEETFNALSSSLQDKLAGDHAKAMQLLMKNTGKVVGSAHKRLGESLRKLQGHLDQSLERVQKEMKEMEDAKNEAVEKADDELTDVDNQGAAIRRKLKAALLSVSGAAKEGVEKSRDLRKQLVASRKKVLQGVRDAFGAAKYDLEGEIKKRGADVTVKNAAKQQLQSLDALLTKVMNNLPGAWLEPENVKDALLSATNVAVDVEESSKAMLQGMLGAAERVRNAISTSEDVSADERAKLLGDFDKSIGVSVVERSAQQEEQRQVSRLMEKAHNVIDQTKLEVRAVEGAGGDVTMHGIMPSTAKLEADAEQGAATLVTAEEEGRRHASAIHNALDALGGILTEEQQEMHARTSREQTDTEAQYRDIGTQVDGLLTQVEDLGAMMQKDIAAAGKAGSALSAKGLAAADANLTRETEKVAGAVDSADSAIMQTSNALEGRLNAAQRMADEEHRLASQEVSGSEHRAGELIHLLSDADQAEIAEATKKVGGLVEELEQTVGALPALRNVFEAQADLKSNIRAHQQVELRRTQGEANRVAGEVASIEAGARAQRGLAADVSRAQQQTITGAEHAGLLSAPVAHLKGFDVAAATEKVVEKSNRLVHNAEGSSKAGLQRVLQDEDKFRDNLVKEMGEEAEVGNKAIEIERQDAASALEKELGTASTATEKLNQLQVGAAELHSRVMRLKDAAKEYMQAGSVSEDARFQAQKEQIRDLSQSLRYYGISSKRHATADSPALRAAADTLREEDRETLAARE